jgi:hypothetical protein
VKFMNLIKGSIYPGSIISTLATISISRKIHLSIVDVIAILVRIIQLHSSTIYSK